MKRWVQIDVPGPTPAEVEILGLMLKGLSAKEIAAVRQRSPKTVEKQISTLLEDTGTHSKGKLVYHALCQGWINPPKRYVD